MIFLILLFLLCVCLTFLYSSLKSKQDYWKKKKVPSCPNPKPIFGNYSDYILLKKFVGEASQEICRAFPNEPYIGTFYGSDPALLVQDPDILKLVMTKDFYYFNSREVSKYTHNEVSTQNLFFTYGDRWKVMRQNMTPIFTTAKMKNMFYLVENCCYTLENLLDYEKSVSDVIEVRTLTARYTMESIGSCAFGIDMNSMEKGFDRNPFILMGSKIMDSSTYRGLKWIARAMWPSVFYGLGFKTFSTDIDKFFESILINIFKSRGYKPTTRNDFIDCVLNLKNNNFITGDSMRNAKTGGNEKVVLEVDNDLMVGLCVVIFAAGFETSSTTMAFTLFELAKHKEAQRRVQEEIDEYLRARENKLTYDCVSTLTYTEACIDEALRLYPVLALLTREVVEDYTLPSGLTLEKDSRVHIPVYHLQRDPANFPDPEEYRPERFLPENKQNIKPYTYMPFGEGPRICIGMRFAKMQMLAGLVTILKKYSVELADDMPEQVTYEPRSIVTSPIGGIKLKFTERDGWEQRVLQK
ncbi:cytochrome P450 6B7-like [Ostrinia nubilalis]|uniref:cytochrome P450 6B7-like n=1 Tax=Ostrinia nubilalis TaxID=29057 RepID=UPI0030822547